MTYCMVYMFSNLKRYWNLGNVWQEASIKFLQHILRTVQYLHPL